ncbi:hypothetical protein [Gryllotalpicola ginsengisoli]|uniref:hypothetical protein n=1 Tax=Gryllotalpicola ginsengisoli TaxID=444608 RepID=UPI0003B75B88|nr:hypothetical protein [Gryllotalpicola ginsengisoli]
MHLAELLKPNAGFATRRMLRDAGWSDYRIRAELAAGSLVAVGRDIVATPRADPVLVRVVRMGGRLACVSAARRLHLRVPPGLGLHIIPRRPTTHLKFDEGVRPVVHWTPQPFGPDAHGLAIESWWNALAHIARCQPAEAALTVFESAVRTRLTSVEELQVLASVHRGPFAAVVARLTSL